MSSAGLVTGADRAAERYRRARIDQTNIHRFRHGWLLLHMVVKGAARLRFV